MSLRSGAPREGLRHAHRRRRPDPYVRQRRARPRRLPRRGLVRADADRGARDAGPGRRRDREDRRAADARRRRRRALGPGRARRPRCHRAQRRAGAARGARQAAHGAAPAPRGLAAPPNAVDHGRPAGVAAAAPGRREAAVRELGARRRAVRRRGVARRAARDACRWSRGTARTVRSCRSSFRRSASTCGSSSPTTT